MNCLIFFSASNCKSIWKVKQYFKFEAIRLFETYVKVIWKSLTTMCEVTGGLCVSRGMLKTPQEYQVFCFESEPCFFTQRPRWWNTM